MQADAAKNLRKFMFWQMAVFNKILKDCRGGIGTAVLAGILCAAVCLHAAAYWVRQEAEENSRRILRRQLQFAVLGAPGSGRKQQAYFAPPAAICSAGTCKSRV